MALDISVGDHVLDLCAAPGKDASVSYSLCSLVCVLLIL